MTTAINLMIRLPVADAPECVSWPEGLTYVPTEVVWSAAYHHGRVWPAWAMAIRGALTTHYGDAIPDWVPRPPDGWDSSVTDHHPRAAKHQRQFIRQESAAKRWDVSVDTIRRMISDGKITGYRLNGRVIRVSVAEVDAAFKPIPTVKAG